MSLPRTRLLLVDDDRDDLELTLDALSRIPAGHRFEVECCDSVPAALRRLAEQEFDAALVDYRLGAETALDLLRPMAASQSAVAVVVLTGRANPDVDQRCLELGAADFLVKDRLDPVVLERSLRYAIERQQLINQLRRQQQEYFSLFEGNPIAMLTFDPDQLRVLKVNRAACLQYGYAREEFEGLSMLALREPADAERFLAYDRAHREWRGPLQAGVWRHLRKDGSTLHVEIIRSDVLQDDRWVRVVTAQDVSLRIAAERALRASERTLRQVLSDMADGLLVIAADGRVLYANPAASTALAVPAQQLVDAPLPPTLASDAASVDWRTAAGEQRELDLRTSSTRWNGRAARTLIIRDVTATRARDRRMALLDRATTAIDEGILVSDMLQPGQPVIYMNPAAERISGYSASEMLGRNCRLLQGDDRQQPAIAEMRRAIAVGGSCTVEVRNYRRDGSLFWNRVTLSPLLNEQGEVTHYVGIMADISLHKQLEAERRYLETHDPLTGLPTFAAQAHDIDRLVERSIDAGLRAAVLFVDLDSFNLVNDTTGFAVGDAALREVAQRLQLMCAEQTSESTLLRYAGDEFVLGLGMLPPAVDVGQLANRFCDAIAEPMTLAPTATLYLTASIGASVAPESARKGSDLVRQADIATHHAKRNGRNGAYVFGLSLSEALNDRLRLGGQMRAALNRDEFILHYQPQINAHDGALVGLEALVRWVSPEFGTLPPRRFISVAESNGMILALGAWVLRKACSQLRQWQDQGLNGFTVSVNVSAAQMQRPSFVADVQQIIEQAGIDPATLELELTESILMDNVDRAITQMTQLKALGVKLVLDDFGMGYSSLDYLRRFPLDKLKIDHAFVKGIIEQDRDAALVRAIIAIGHNLGMRVVAEGVETAAQAAYLRRNYCDELQGFHIAEAIPVEDIPDLVRRRYLLPAESSGKADEAAQRTLLILDDEDNIRRSLSRLLRRDGYQVLTAATASEAFQLLAMHAVQVVLSDQRMPDLSGTEFLSRVKDMYPDTVRMVLSGYTDLSTLTDAINHGAIYKFLTKPWDDDDLRAQVQEAFRRHAQNLQQR